MIQSLLFITITFFTHFVFSMITIESVMSQNLANQCRSLYTETNELFMSEFKWSYTPLEMEEKFNTIYSSGKRIQMHANFDASLNSFVLYHGSYEKNNKITITENFINSVRLQIETAIKNGFSDYVFFPDMGHSHLYFEQAHWDQNYLNKYELKDNSKQYEAMFADPKLSVLYHLTEQLQMLNDQKQPINSILEFKYLNRNFMGRNNQTNYFEIHRVSEKNKYNTVGDISGYYRWGQGFAVSASIDGCFPYKDKNGNTKYFDISIYDPRYDPNNLPSDMNGY